MIYLTLCNAGVESHVQRAQWVAIVPVEVGALCRLAYAIEAVDFQVGSEGKTCLERVDPFGWKKLIIFYLVFGVSDSLGIATLEHIFVPSFGFAPEKWKRFVDGQIMALR